jgi:hypothetical protein
MGEWGWRMEGLTGNYLRVNAVTPSPRWNEIDLMKINEWDGDHLSGALVEME